MNLVNLLAGTVWYPTSSAVDLPHVGSDAEAVVLG